MTNKLSIIILLTLALTSCNNSNTNKQKKLDEINRSSKRKELNEKKLSKNDAIILAEKQFELYLPKILHSHYDARLDLQESYIGDFTGDGVEDVAIYFSLAPSDGGNAIVGQGLTLYQTLENKVKVIAGYDPDYPFSFNRISNGKIYVEKLEYTDDDPRCCPSIKTEHALTILGSSVY